MKHLSMYVLTAAAILTCAFAVPTQVQAAEKTVNAEAELIAAEPIDPTLLYEDTLLTLINEERAKHGLYAYVLDEAVDVASETRVIELESVFSHNRNGGKRFSTILTESGLSYSSASEIIAAGQTTPELVLTAWMESPRHCRRLLSSEYTRIGVAHDRAEDGTDYWEILFLN